MRIGCLYVDEFVPEPNTPQGKVRIEPDISLDKPLESALCILQKIRRSSVGGHLIVSLVPALTGEAAVV